MNIKLLQLAKMILNLGSAKLEDGTVLNWDGELVEGTEVFVENEGELVPATDGEYNIEGKVIVISEGKVAEMKEPEPETKPDEQNNEEQQPPVNVPDEKDKKIAELEARIGKLEVDNAELEAENAELKAQLEAKNQEMSSMQATIKEQEQKLAESVNVPAKDKDKKQKTHTFKSYL